MKSFLLSTVISQDSKTQVFTFWNWACLRDFPPPRFGSLAGRSGKKRTFPQFFMCLYKMVVLPQSRFSLLHTPLFAVFSFTAVKHLRRMHLFLAHRSLHASARCMHAKSGDARQQSTAEQRRNKVCTDERSAVCTDVSSF